MNTCIVNEHQSLRVISSLVRIYPVASPCAIYVSRDIDHIVAAYELCDKEVAIACNRYIITKYPMLHRVAANYGLRPMDEAEIYMRTKEELQHMLYSLCVFLYDDLKAKTLLPPQNC